jgi:hypothetical protein
MAHTEDDFPTRDQIETRAYELYLTRGEGSSAIENWLAAEHELKQERASAPLRAKATSAGQRNPA